MGFRIKEFRAFGIQKINKWKRLEEKKKDEQKKIEGSTERDKRIQKELKKRSRKEKKSFILVVFCFAPIITWCASAKTYFCV
jgi:nitrate reductase NapE component